jgi:hypothetical protein
VSTPAAGSQAALAANKFLQGRGVPESGSGVIRNDQTGAITTINNPIQMPAFVGQQPAAPAATSAPQLGTQGGIFTNLAQYQKDFGKAAMGSAGANRAEKQKALAQEAEFAQQKLGTEQSKLALDAALRVAGLGIQQQTANAATATAATKQRDQIVQSTDAAGNPVLINKTTGRMTHPQDIPDFATFDAKMREDNRNAALTPEEMQAIYNRQFGQ